MTETQQRKEARLLAERLRDLFAGLTVPGIINGTPGTVTAMSPESKTGIAARLIDDFCVAGRSSLESEPPEGSMLAKRISHYKERAEKAESENKRLREDLADAMALIRSTDAFNREPYASQVRNLIARGAIRGTNV